MLRMFAQKGLAGLITTNKPKSCTYSTKPEVTAVLTEICELLATRSGLIDLPALQRCPQNKLIEISSLFTPQKHCPDALVFIEKHELFKINTLMECDLATIQAYKGYLFNLHPAVADNNMAINLETFKNLPPTYQRAYSDPNIVDEESNYRKPGYGG